MTKHKYTTAICIGLTVFMVAITLLFMFGEALGISISRAEPPYVTSLFSTDKVHTLDIIVDEGSWEDMLANAGAKEYILAHVVIDGNHVKNVGIRPKGNSSLSSILMSESDRYSFKIEFDHYDKTQSYQGLDKLALNNIVQDNTYLKDYVSYQMMTAFGADAPLSSFIYITVNGEEWGLYLAVEGIEEAFALRNYGSDYGQIYKPDNLNINMERGNAETESNPRFPGMPNMQDMPNMPNMQTRNNFGGMPGGLGARNNSDIALIYIDDQYESYPNIFDNAKFNPSDADKDRLIAAIKQLNAGTDLESVINIDEVIRYFVVHNFVLNFDSYTGSMLHNYYLHEKDGRLSMIAWDYNLAFAGMGMGGMGNMFGGSTTTATSAVNYPIDTPVSGASMEERPLLNQLLSSSVYLATYHELFQEFISGYFASGEFEEMYDNAVNLIAPYVAKDPTAFCTYDEFMAGQTTLKEFCILRAESIRRQLDGTIGITSESQIASNNAGFVDASHINMNLMGSNMMGFDRTRNFEEMNRNDNPREFFGNMMPREAR